MRHLSLLLCSAVLLCSTGCQQRIASELLGKWEGRPDTKAQRQQREAEKYGDAPEQETDATDTAATDWEQYDASIAFDFRSRSEVSVSLSGQSEAVEGTWHVVQSGPSNCVIEIQSDTGAEGQTELRRYRLEFDLVDDGLRGFLLTEVGADRDLGALYCSRPAQ